MDKITKRPVAYWLSFLLGAFFGIAYGLVAYSGDRLAELSNRHNFGEWRLPLVILIGLVWSVSIARFYYNFWCYRKASKQVEGYVILTAMMPLHMGYLVPVLLHNYSPILISLASGLIYALLSLGWSYVLNQRLKARHAIG